MKNLILLSILLFAASAKAQSVNGVQLKDLQSEYVMIVGTKQLFSQKVAIELEFGQLNRSFSLKDSQVKDEKGRPILLNSMIDALNFMSKFGYEFVDAYAMSTGNNQAVYHFIMRKKDVESEFQVGKP